MVSVMVVRSASLNEAKCERVMAGILLKLNRSCSHAKNSLAKLIFLCTKLSVLLALLASASSFYSNI